MDGDSRQALLNLLRWYLEAGVEDPVAAAPVNRFTVDPGPGTTARAPSDPPPASPPSPTPPPPSLPTAAVADGPTRRAAKAAAGRIPDRALPDRVLPDRAAGAARSAEQADSLTALKAAIAQFDGCPLRATATNLVFGDGNPHARIVLIGEAPGAEEDRLGLPFVGPSGKLLDRMLASIGLDRSQVFISNTVFWRPPGNRAPTSQEVAVCMPFVERMIELIHPKLLVALGGPAANALLQQNDSVGRLRGRWFSYRTPRLAEPIAATALFHPAYLLRSPAQKRLAWRDLLAIKKRILEDNTLQ